jgi:hypothetical protein
MTLSAQANLERRLARVEAENASRFRATTLARTSRAVFDGDLGDLVICFDGRKYPCDARTIAHFVGQGVSVELPKPLKPIQRAKADAPETAFPRASAVPTPPHAIGKKTSTPRELTAYERWRRKVFYGGKDPDGATTAVKAAP